MSNDFVDFLHSLLRYLILVSVGYAAVSHLLGLLLKRPILNMQRSAAIIGMVLCHVQLVLGAVLLIRNWSVFMGPHAEAYHRFIAHEHAGSMIIAITLVTLGRSLAKRCNEERGKQVRIAAFYGIALLLMLWATPWPFREVGRLVGISWI
jgi:hypothetical protein